MLSLKDYVRMEKMIWESSSVLSSLELILEIAVYLLCLVIEIASTELY